MGSGTKKVTQSEKPCELDRAEAIRGGEPVKEWERRRASYEREREHLCKSSMDVSARYDQWIVTLPSGALVLSLGFLEKFAPHPESETAIWLVFAWIVLIASLLAA